ncbi:peritrophin-1-like [Culex pipiens pallens]|uniref:peritrophin-1-like n=1 Tax=Culex pipiens pallens TaxID=42434 RepID=UPI0022AA3E02|nr:peritrophin-1-like [Culex pipiens pallens]
MCRKTFHLLVISLLSLSISHGEDFNPEICQDKPDGTQVRNPFQCNMFFVCEGGMIDENEGMCPDGLLFNPDPAGCDIPANVNCGDVPLPPGFETEAPTQTPPTEGPTTVLPTTQQPDRERCPEEDPEEPVFLSVADDCAAYILCFHGREILRKCPAGLHWNRLSNDCDDPKKVTCPEHNVYGCPEDGIDFLPHPDGCRRFIYCRDGFARVQGCSPYHGYDVEKKTCVFNVACWT